ncbi:MAG: hypothetical protein RI894_532 [Bacteroidota bacterium]|jgi:hypothetical protein
MRLFFTIICLLFSQISAYSKINTVLITPKRPIVPSLSEQLFIYYYLGEGRTPFFVPNVAPNGTIQQLIAAYPQYLARADGNTLLWKDGTRMPFDDGKTPSNYLQLLDNADLADQLKTPYHTGSPSGVPAQNEDPGRVRNELFFKKMYGNSSKEVAKNLTDVDWFGTKLKVTKINGVDEKLRAIAAELATKPALKKYLVKPGGTFKWRIIAQTKRLSMHSFGIAIDINTGFSNYWQWAGKGKKVKEGSAGIVYKNKIPIEIVEIFEKYHFIWGGKWYHYDTMHFEYRPELF